MTSAQSALRRSLTAVAVSVCFFSVEQKLIAEGAIVPVAVTLGLLKEAMQENMKQGKFNFLVDGYEEATMSGLRADEHAPAVSQQSVPLSDSLAVSCFASLCYSVSLATRTTWTAGTAPCRTSPWSSSVWCWTARRP